MSKTNSSFNDSRTDNSHRLSRKQVAAKLKMSIRSVGRLDGTELHPENENGRIWYSLAEVERVAAVRRQANGEAPETDEIRPSAEGRVASRVLDAFAQGKTPTRVVIDESLPPDVVKQLHQAWMDLEGFFVIRGADLIGFRKLLPNVKTAASLVATIEMLAEAFHELKRFVFPCCVCGKPVQATSAGSWAAILQGEALTQWGHAECINRHDPHVDER
jgi:hypothetical protein